MNIRKEIRIILEKTTRLLPAFRRPIKTSILRSSRKKRTIIISTYNNNSQMIINKYSNKHGNQYLVQEIKN